MTQLVPRYPGSKRLYSLLDRFDYGCIVEPFGGSLATSLKAIEGGVKAIQVADADPTVSAIYWCWARQDADLPGAVDLWRLRFEAHPNEAWAGLKLEIEAAVEGSIANSSRVAAASLVLRKLAFGGVIRYSANGKLNIAPNRDQLEKLAQWSYEYPSTNGANILVRNSWQECFTGIPKDSFCLIDPPYYLPRSCGRMTPAYWRHEPHDRETLHLCLDAVQLAVQCPQISRIVVCNYASPELDEFMGSIGRMGLPVKRATFGRCDSINRTRKAVTNAEEVLWFIGEEKYKQLEIA